MFYQFLLSIFAQETAVCLVPCMLSSLPSRPAVWLSEEGSSLQSVLSDLDSIVLETTKLVSADYVFQALIPMYRFPSNKYYKACSNIDFGSDAVREVEALKKGEVGENASLLVTGIYSPGPYQKHNSQLICFHRPVCLMLHGHPARLGTQMAHK